MKVTIYSRAEEFLDDYDYHDFLRVEIDGQIALSVCDGETEDNNLGRNFSEIQNLDTLIQAAFVAGSNGESLSISHKEVEE